MKISKIKEAEARKAYEVYFDSYINGDVKTIASMLDKNYNQIGSAEAEVFYNKNEAVQFLKDTIEQVAGKTEMRSRFIKLDQLEKYILITDLFDIYVLIEEEWTFYSKFRASTLMEQKEDGWKFIHQHSSLPDTRTGDGDNIAIEKITAENLQLRDAVKRRTVELENKSKELEVETSLERVRAIAMSMRKSDDMLEVCQIISEQLESLGVTDIRNIQVAIIDESNKNYLNYQYFTPYSKKVFEVTEYEKNPASQAMVTEMQKSANSFFIGDMQEKELEEFREWRKKHNQFADPLLDKTSAVFYYFYSIGNGGLGLTTYKAISDTNLDIYKRFHKVFELAYRRFHDIEKAEAQAKEAQIEAALERVRARSMAMHKSEELADLSLELVKQVHALGVATWFCAFNIYDDDPEGSLEWGSNGQGTFPKYRTPREGIFHRYYEAGQRGETLFINEIDENECPAHYDYLCSLPGVGEQLLKMKDAGIPFPTSQIDHVAFFEYGYILFITFEQAPEAHDIFKRFAKVFEQTYTRFLDLQKAEAQAREAKIEAALERVRARSMAMHQSDELKDVIKVIFNQMAHLNINAEHAGIVVDYEPKKDWHFWVAETQDIPSKITLPYLDLVWDKQFTEAKKKSMNFFTTQLDFEEKNSFYKDLLPHIQGLTKKARDHYFSCPGLSISTVIEKDIGLYIENFSGIPYSDEENNTLMRFGKVFQQTYTRFLDLKKAEAQAREAQIETALEKVRSRTMAMQKGEELKEVVVLLYKELIALGVNNFVTCGYVEINEKINRQFTWVTSPGGDSLGLFYLPLTGDETFDERYAAWKQQQIIFHQKVAGEVRLKHLEYAITTFNSKEAEEMVLGQFPDPCVFYCFNFSHGYLHLVTGSKLKNEEELLLARFTKVFEQTYARFLDLQKAEAQAREAQIEAALERVRSRSMAMHQSTELLEVSNVLFQQLRSLGGELWGSGVVICNANSNDDEVWFANEKGVLPPVAVPHTKDPTHKKMYDGWKKKMDLLSITKEGKELKTHYDYMLSVPAVKPLFESILESGLSFPEKQTWYAAYFNFGYLLMITIEPYPDEQVLVRFAKVFKQTYTRFLDLQKAEAQIREAQIEGALEKVRSRSIGMQKSEELKEVIQVIHDQLIHLNFKIDAAGFTMDYFQNNDWNIWIANKNQSLPSKIYIPYIDHPQFNYYKGAKEKGLDFFANTLSFEDKNSIFNYMFEFMGDYPQAERDQVLNAPGLAISQAFLKNITLWIYNLDGNPYTAEDNDILMRFARVFEQTYVRFNDLQKAETQARESQIELALERIRAQVTAMSESADLLDIVVTMRSEFVALGHEAHYFWYMKWHPEIYEKAMTSGDGTQIGMVMSLPRHIHGDIKLIDDWEKSDESTVVFAMDVETAVDYVNKMITLGDFKQVDPNAPTLDDIRHIGGLTFIMARTTHGEIGYSLPGVVPNPPEEDLNILVRFASVFDLAYRRFEDLKSAEQQNRKSQIELALERVRARALAMQLPEELKDVADVLRNEMGKLGIEELETCSIYINDESAEKAECWYALKDVRESETTLVNDYFALNLKDTWVGREMLKFYKSRNKQVSIVMTGKPRIEWIRYCEEKSVPLRGYYGDVIPDRTYHLYKFSHGAIGVATPESISDENWDLLNRAASVFSLAYSRFKDLTQARTDLQRLKEEKKRAEEALSDLKSTQNQLVHAEKMASLGELTAGIAHEIQNPLNFVNNFSEVNTELIEELKDELKNGELDEVIAIADDIAGNEEKIKHHGKRAEAIVKGMLQHSRTTAGEKELTDINELADEFLRLAYHGLRAKDKSFNADFRTELDKKLPKVNVVPQDIGRVLLNLINNAFFTVSDRAKQSENDYKPSVQVSTKSLDDKIEINVKDNGNGVPNNIKEKIFQPFFTTKPTGEGTGLGLSLSYDIITKGHGGEMKVETTVGEGSEFIIQLPA